MAFYAIRHKPTGRYLTVESTLVEYEGGVENCSEFLLQMTDCNPIWVVQSLELASFARCTSAPDNFSSSYIRPINEFNSSELEIVNLETGEVEADEDIFPSDLQVQDFLTSCSEYLSDEAQEALSKRKTYTWRTYQEYLRKSTEEGY